MSVPLYQLPEQQPSVWQPTSVEEAMHLKHQWGDNSVLISGGTWLRTRWENGLSSTPQHLISLGRIPALSGLTIDTLGHVHIGPACCLSDLMENELMRQRCGLLVQACSEIAAPSVRNLASIGGNVVTRTGDLIPVLLVMDAQVGWSDGQQERILPLKEWLESKHFTSYEVMTKIVVRASEEDRTEQTEAEQKDAEPQTNVEQTHAEQIDQDLEHSHEFYLKVGRREAFTPSVVTVAGSLRMAADGTIAAIALSAGGGSAIPARFTELEDAVTGKLLSKEVLQTLHKGVSEGFEAVADDYAGVAYRKMTAANLIVSECYKAWRKGAEPMLLGRDTYAKKWIIRPDGEEKVTGKLQYLTDLTAPGMLHGKVLRSKYPHAWILSIDTSKAKATAGVRAVITAENVPGMNLFGIAFPHQPVLCHERVRYIGDAVAAVAADTEEIAEYALSLIEVIYEPLPVVDNPETALDDGTVFLHPEGNLLHRTSLKQGEVESAFAQCAHIVEETYFTPRQMHTYMETEGGLFIPEKDGRLTVYSPTQHGYKDRMQLARILAMEEEQIRVVSSPIGGSFGGKDELNVQPFGAMLALMTGAPIKMHNSRRESVIAGIKRHPMRITMKTGTDANGHLIAHQVSILADTGAYATLGCEVLNFATEHAIGPYTIPHIDVKGTSVYTNNGVSGEFRGFGGNQVIFAVESQIERLAEKLGMDAWELRRLNLRAPSDPGPMGQEIVPTEGASQVWHKAQASPLWAKRGKPHVSTLEPWLRRGVGASMVMHGAGLGLGIPDHSGGRIELTPEGKIQASFGFEEFGQGLYAALTLMLQDCFGCAADDIRIVIGDTDRVPSSGSSTASRATTMMWRALQRLKPPFVQALLEQAAALGGFAPEELTTGIGGLHRKGDGEGQPVVTYAQVAAAADQAAKPILAQTAFDYPTTPAGQVGAHYLYSYAAAIVEVEVNMLTGRVRVVATDHVIAAGPVINPMGFLGQIEGGSVMALGFTLTEDAAMQESSYVRHNLDTYLIPTFRDSPQIIRVEAIEELPEGDTFGPRGVGEIGSVGLAPAITAAVRQATGIWVNRLPISPEDIVQSIDWLEGVEAID